MEENKRKNNKFSIKELFVNRKYRLLALAILLIPIFCFMAFFGVTIYKEAKQLISMASEETTQADLNTIENYNYVLRDNATELQNELFEQLRTDLNNPETSGVTLAEDVCKNYIADFYTWTNKVSQYDVGGLYYLHVWKDFKRATYTQARDGMYKYLSTYIEKYGAENLIEVSSVNATATKNFDIYEIPHERVNENDEIEYYSDEFESYTVKCDWMYKPTTGFSTTNFEKSKTFIVVNNNGRYEIVEAY